MVVTQTNKTNNNKQPSLLQQSLQNSLVIHEDEQLDSASALAVSLGNGKFDYVFHSVCCCLEKNKQITNIMIFIKIIILGVFVSFRNLIYHS